MRKSHDPVSYTHLNIAVGATMPSINTKLLGEVEIALPDLNNQKRIAAVLSSLDDKIEKMCIRDSIGAVFVGNLFSGIFDSIQHD